MGDVFGMVLTDFFRTGLCFFPSRNARNSRRFAFGIYFFAHKLHKLTQKYFFIAHELHKYDKFISCVACFSRNSYAELTLCKKNTPEREIQG